MKLIVTLPSTYPAERDYILSVILKEFLGLDYIIQRTGKVDVCISDKDKKHCLIIPDGLIAIPESKWLTKESLPSQPLQRLDLRTIGLDEGIGLSHTPVLYDPYYPHRDEVNKHNDQEIRVPIDIFGSCFFMLTRYEELVKQERDEHDRFPGKESLACQEGLVDRPIVNEYVEILWLYMKSLWPGLERKKREYRLILSHDVDDVFAVVEKPAKQVIRRIGGDLIVRRDPILTLKSIQAALWDDPAKDPCNTFDFIMDQSEKCGVTSTFNFMADIGESEYDGRYRIDHPWVRNCLRRIVERGHLIGFHSTYGSYLNAERVKSEFLQLKKAAEEEGVHQDEWGGRQHYLRWNNPSTWQHWEDAGLTYDSTVGFANRIGFRTGCCYEYPVFNLKTRKTLSLRERPLVVMESVVTNRDGTLGEEPQKRICLLNQLCKRFSGDFTLLWHNGSVISQKQKNAYIATLRALL